MVQCGLEDDVISLPDDLSPPYAQEFIDFIDEATSIYHTSAYFVRKLKEAGFKQILESEDWTSSLEAGGKYYVLRTPSLIAFQIPEGFESGETPFIITASHIDALCLKVKPHSKLAEKNGWDRLSVAPYSGGGASQRWDGSYSTWWDRDLGCAGMVLVKGKNGGVEEQLVQLPGAVASIPSLAVHFGDPARGPFNYETNMVPVLGLASKDDDAKELNTVMSKHHSSRFLNAIASSLGKGVSAADILDFSLEMYATQPATLLGLDNEMIAAPRMDDRLCSFAAVHALINSSSEATGSVKVVALFDTEEVGSGLRVGAKSNFVRSVVTRIVETFAKGNKHHNTVAQTLAKSFMLSADVSHAYNPNFDGIYLEGASPALNTGPSIYMDPNAHMTSTPWSATFIRMISEKVGPSGGEVQILYPRSDSRTGGTVGPTLSEGMGIRSLDMGIPMLSMHSIRAITGSKDVGLAVNLWAGMYKYGAEILSNLPGWI